MSESQTDRIPKRVTESFKRGRFTELSTGCRDLQKAVQGIGGLATEGGGITQRPRGQRQEP